MPDQTGTLVRAVVDGSVDDAPSTPEVGSLVLMRAAVRAVVAIAVGAALGGMVANATTPSHDQLQEFAEDLVPPGAELTGASVVSGFEPFVGPPEAIADFESGDAEVAAVAEAVRVHATTLGWTHTETDERSGGEIQRWSRPEAKAAVYIRNSASADDGAIFVTHLASPMGRLIAGLLLGAGAGLFVAFALPVITARLLFARLHTPIT